MSRSAAKIEVVDTTQEHIDYVAAHLRQHDVDELQATAPVNIRNFVQYSVDFSDDPKTLLADGKPVVVGGVGPTSIATPRKGKVWLLATDLVEKHPLAYIKEITRYFNSRKADFDVLENYVHEKNELSIRFIKAMGYTIDDEPTPFGWRKARFYHFKKVLN